MGLNLSIIKPLSVSSVPFIIGPTYDAMERISPPKIYHICTVLHP